MEETHRWGGYKVVLASASPRRKELLAQIGIDPEICPSQIEEETKEHKPEAGVMELSRQKAEDIAGRLGPGTLVIGADTVVAVGREILGKPEIHIRCIRELPFFCVRRRDAAMGSRLQNEPMWRYIP